MTNQNGEVEFQRLLSLIKDPIDRKWILASIDPKLSLKQKIKRLEHYIEYLGGYALEENLELIENTLDLNSVFKNDQQQLTESFLRMFRLGNKENSRKNFWFRPFPS